MWIAATLTFCFLIPSGDIKCDSAEPRFLVEKPPLYATEAACQRQMIFDGMRSALEAGLPIVSLQPHCDVVGGDA